MCSLLKFFEAGPYRQNDKDKVSRFMLNACQKSEFALWLDELIAAKLHRLFYFNVSLSEQHLMIKCAQFKGSRMYGPYTL